MAAVLEDSAGVALEVGQRVSEIDFSFGDGLVESITVPSVGGGFNVGVKWDDPSLDGPTWSEDGGGRGAKHLLVIAPALPPNAHMPPALESLQALAGVSDATHRDAAWVSRFFDRFGRGPSESEIDVDEDDWSEIDIDREDPAFQGGFSPMVSRSRSPSPIATDPVRACVTAAIRAILRSYQQQDDSHSMVLSEGDRVKATGNEGLVMAIKDERAIVAFDNYRYGFMGCSAIVLESPSKSTGVHGVLRATDGHRFVQAYLEGPTFVQDSWRSFSRYTPASLDSAEGCLPHATPPVDVAFHAGSKVTFHGPAVPVISPGRGKRAPPCPLQGEATVCAFLLGTDGKEERRLVLVQVEGSPASTMHFVALDDINVGDGDGSVFPSFEIVQAQLQLRTPAAVWKARQVAGPASRRSERQPPPPPAAAATAPNTTRQPPIQQLYRNNFELKGVLQPVLLKHSDRTLRELCTERGLSVPRDAGKDALVAALTAWRAKKGRARRRQSSAASSSGGGGGGTGEGEGEGESEGEGKGEGEGEGDGEGDRDSDRASAHKQRKRKRERERTPSPAPSSSSSSSSASTPWSAVKRKQDLAAAEAARLARLHEAVDRDERKRHEKRKKKHKKHEKHKR